MAPVVTKYSDVEKLDRRSGQYEKFFPLRIVGLAYELGHKLAHEKGLWAVTWEDLRYVNVSGTVRVRENNRWRAARSQVVQMQKEDAMLAHALLRKQLAIVCNDLRLNVCEVDVKSATGSLDLVGYFTTKQCYECQGRLWVELKAFGWKSFAKRFQEAQGELLQRFGQEESKDASLCGVLLLAAKVQKAGGGWGKPNMVAGLWRKGDEDWHILSGENPRKGRGRCKGEKKTLREILEGMEWVKSDDGEKVGYLRHFLRELGLRYDHADERVLTFNQHLRSLGRPDKIEQKTIPGRCGKPPYVGSKATFRVLYDVV